MNTSKQHKETGKYKLPPDEYRRILAGLQLRSLELIACHMEKPVDPSVERRVIETALSEEAQLLDPIPTEFGALHRYKLSGLVEGKSVFDIEAAYLLLFISEQQVSKEFFEIFCEMNLAVHTWPFFRELVSSMTSRTSLPTLTLPLRIAG